MRPFYAADFPRGVYNDKESQLQVEFLKKEKLLLRWGIHMDTLGTPHEGGNVRKRGISDPALGTTPLPLSADIPLPSGTDRILFRSGEIPVYEQSVPRRGPVFKKKIIIGAKKRGKIRISWEVSHPNDMALFFNVRTSADRGKTWMRLATGLMNSELQVPAEAIIGGKDCLVEVIAYDGVNTSKKRRAFLKSRRPEFRVDIMSPKEGKVPLTAPVILRALAYIPNIRLDRQKAITYIWMADGDKIAEGQSAIWANPAGGKHEIILIAQWGKKALKVKRKVIIGKAAGE
jgi:hypothetical protein